MIFLFSLAIILAMVICFFSLMSSAHVSIFEQTNEIGVLKILGMTSFQIFRTYTYESFIIVFTSAILGACIGSFLGWTIYIQNSLYTHLPIPLFFPWQLFLITCGMSLICSLFSVWKPIRTLMKRPIVNLLKS